MSSCALQERIMGYVHSSGIINLQLQSVKDRQRTVLPCVQPRITSHPNTCLFTLAWPQAGDFRLSRRSHESV